MRTLPMQHSNIMFSNYHRCEASCRGCWKLLELWCFAPIAGEGGRTHVCQALADSDSSQGSVLVQCTDSLIPSLILTCVSEVF